MIKINNILNQFSTIAICLIIGMFLMSSASGQQSLEEPNLRDERNQVSMKARKSLRDISPTVNCGPSNASSTIRPKIQDNGNPCSDTVFLVDSDVGLDTGCSYRGDGPLRFNVKIDRFVGNLAKLKASGAIGQIVTLRLPAFDVDYTGGGSGTAPERDKILINGHEIGFLQGSNGVWHLNEFKIPIEWLNFPTEAGGQPADNIIQINIDTANNSESWCTAIDWATADIKVARPVLLVHGIFSHENTWNNWGTEFDVSNGFLDNLGIPYERIEMNSSPQIISTIQSNAALIRARVESMKQRYKVEKINIVGHSKGGLDARDYAESSDSVSQLIQIGTPNAGSPWADLAVVAAVAGDIYGGFGGRINLLASTLAPGGYQLTTPYMRGYNLFSGHNDSVKYSALAGKFIPDCFFCGVGAIDFLVIPDGDLVVPVSSVYSLSFVNNMPAFSRGGEDECLSALLPGNTNNLAQCEAVHTKQTQSFALFNVLKSKLIEFDQTTGGNLSERKMKKSTDKDLLITELPPPVAAISRVGNLQQGQTQMQTMTVDQSTNVIFELQYPSGNLDLALISPSGERFDAVTTSGNPNVRVFDHPILGGRTESFIFGTIESGVWTAEVTAVSVIEASGVAAYGLSSYMKNSSVTFSGGFQSQNVPVNGTLKLLGTLRNGTNSITEATASALVLLPNNMGQEIPLRDDGTNGDITPNDGIYSADFSNTAVPGQYKVVFQANRIAGGGFPAFSRESLNTATVSPSSSAFTGTFNSTGNDTNANTLFDELNVQANLNISHAGNYQIRGVLSDSAGNTQEASTTLNLSAGQQVATIKFNGKRIFQNRVDGPYALSKIQLLEINGTDETLIDSRENAHQTAAFPFRNFERNPIVFTGTGSAVGVDTNGNGLFELLRTTLQVEVLRAGTYNWTVQLVDRNGRDLGFVSGSGSLIVGANNIVVNFSGARIRQNNVDGPLKITGLLVYGQGFTLIEQDVLTTQPFSANQFEGCAFVLNPGTVSFPSLGGTGSFTINTPAGCNWTVNSNAAWIVINSSTVNTVNFTVSPNPGDPRVGTITIGTDVFIVNQTSNTAKYDFDGDGRADVSVFRPSNGTWYINRSMQGFAALRWGIASDNIVPADYDGDGKTDFAVFRPSLTSSSESDFFILNSSDYTVFAPAWGTPEDLPAIGDYDLDGKDDVAVYRPSMGVWYVLPSSGISTIIRTTALGTPVPADYDGDGKTDFAVFNMGVWTIQRSSGGTAELNWGLETDMLVPSDYDGDGKDDVAVFRPSDGTWYILKSSNNSPLVYQWGIEGDMPTPADYDGDGKDDIAVFRNGVWYLQRSNSGLQIVNFGLSGDKPVPSVYQP